jgi:hypothetical protein
MQDKINSVLQYLDLDTERKKINSILFPLFCFEALSCLLMAEKINFIVTTSLAMVVFIIMLIWRININKNSKSLLLYLGVGGGLWALCFLLIALSISYINFLWSCVFLIIILLVSIPANIYLVKKNARKIFEDGHVDIKLPESCYKGAGVIGMFIGTLLLKFLGFHFSSIIMFFIFIIIVCVCIYATIRCFYKHILRNRYDIDELLKQSNMKPKAKIRR